jgi:hypothetical protein
VAVAHFGGVGLQPVICAFGLYILMRILMCSEIPGSIVIWILAGVFAGGVVTLLSIDPAYSLKYLLLQSVYLCVVGLAVGWMLVDPRDRACFLNGFLSGAGVSSILALAQVALSQSIGFYPKVTNNQNFSLIAPADRGVAFTPEASILATLLIPATLIAYLAWRGRWPSAWPPFTHGAFVILLLAGLLITRSSSLFLLPVLLVGYELFAATDPRVLLRRGAAALLGAAVILMLFLPHYQARLDRSDAQYSTMGRAEKLMAGIRIFSEHPVTGAGLGMVSDPNFFDPYVVHVADWSWQKNSSRKGIDSSVLRTAAESGLLGLFALYYPVFLALGAAKRALLNPEYAAPAVLAISLLLSQALVTGYRDLPFMLLPMAILLLAPGFAFRQAPTSPPPTSPPPTSPPPTSPPPNSPQGQAVRS